MGAQKFEIFLTLILVIYAAIEGLKWKKISPIKKGFVVLVITSALITAFVAYQEIQKEILLEKINASFGDITDSQNATFPNIAVGDNDSAAVLRVGGNGVCSFTNMPNLFKVYVKDSKLYINIVIYDEGGKPIAAVYENTWTRYNNDYEYNNDDNAFEIVREGDRQVYFHIELRNGKAFVSGFIYTVTGYGLYLYEDNKNSILQPLVPNLYYNPPNIVSPLFKYPREKYMGVRDK